MTSPSAEPPRRPAATRTHQVHRFLGRLHEVLDEVGTETLWALSPEELSACLREAYAAQARVAALTLALVAQAETSGLATHEGEVNLVAWLRDRVRLAPAEGKRQIKLARALEQHDLLRVALAAGVFPAASATVAADALGALPADVDPDTLRRAEEHLTGEAHAHDTQALRRIADHLEEVLDPHGHDARLAEQLTREQAKAERRAFLALHHDETTAMTEGHFRLPLLSGAKLERMVQSLTNPARPDPIPALDPETGLRYTAEERRGHALIELLDRYPVAKLPKLGGSDPRVVVIMELQTLMGGLRAASLDTGQAISPGPSPGPGPPAGRPGRDHPCRPRHR